MPTADVDARIIEKSSFSFVGERVWIAYSSCVVEVGGVGSCRRVCRIYRKGAFSCIIINNE